MAPPFKPRSDLQRAASSELNVKRNSIRPTKLTFETPKRPAKTPTPAPAPQLTTPRLPSAPPSAATPRRSTAATAPSAPPSTPSANPALARLAPTLAAHIHPTPRAHLNATPAPRAGRPRFESHVRWRELDKGNLAAWLGHVLEVRVGGEGLAGASAKKVVVGMAALERERVGGMMEGFRNEIEDGRVQVQEGVKLRTDDVVRTKVVRLLVSSYEPAWLLPCLAVVLRETRCLDLASLGDFPRDEAVVGHIETVLRERLLGDNLDVRRYIAPLADRLPNPVSLTDDVFNATVLDVLFTIILLLDAAKVSAATATVPPSVLPGANDPPLFRHAAALTTSDDVATKLAALLIKTSNGFGNFRRDLRAVGYKLSYTVPAYEAARGFRVPDNIETGLRDGAVLCKLASLLSRDRAILHELVDPASLSSAGSRKEVESACRTNLRLALRSFKRTSETSVNYQQQLKYDWPSASRPLAEGDLDATIALVWRVEELWVSERVIGDFAAVKSEVARLHRVFRKDRESQKEEVNGGGGLTARRRRKAELLAVLDNSPSYIDNFEIHCDGSGSHEVLAWVSAVGLFYGKKVREWTESFRDGSILCLLIHHYYPDQMAREEIKSVLWAEGRRNDETKSNEAAFARANFDMFSDAAALLGGIPYLPVAVSAALAPEFASDDKPKSFGHQMQLLASYLFARCVSFKPITDEEEDLFSELESSSLTPLAHNSLQEAEEESERRLEAMIQAMQDDAARDAADYTRSQRSYNSAASGTQSAVPPLRITIDDASDRPSEFSRWNQMQLVAARYIESFVTSCYLRNQYKQKQKAVATITFRRRVAQAFRIHARWAAAANTIQAAWIARQSREYRSKSNALRGPLTSYVSRRDWAMTESLAQTIQAKKVAMKSASDFPTAVLSRGYETEQEGACAVLQMTYRGMASRRMESARLLEENAQAEAMEVARLEKILEERTAHLAKREKGQSELDSRALLSFTIFQALSAGRAAFCENMSVYDTFAARACQDSMLQATAAAELQHRYESTKDVQLADVAKDQRTAAKMSQYIQALETNLGRLEDELKHEKESADELQSLLTEMRTTQVILESDAARRKLEKKEADVHEKFLADSTREIVEYQTRFVDLARERIDRLHEAARRTEISHELDEKARFSCHIRDLELALGLAETACEKRRREHHDEIVACSEKAEYVDSNRSMFDDAASPADMVDDKLDSLLRSVAEALEKDRNSAFFSFPAGLFLQSDYGRDVACSGSSAASDELFQGPDLFVAWSAEKDKIEHSAVKADIRQRKLDALMENEIHHIALQQKRAEAVASNLDEKAQASFAQRKHLERLRICFEKVSLTCSSAKSSYDGQVDRSESDIALLDQCRDIALRQVDEESDLNWLKSLSQELSKADACESKWDAFYATVPDATLDWKILSAESSDGEDLDAGRHNSYDDWCSAKEKLAESTNVARNRDQELDDLIARSLDERVSASLLQRELSAKQKVPSLEAADACVVAESSYQEQVEHEAGQVAILEQRRALAIEQNIAETIYVPLTPLVGDIALAAEINSELDVCFSSFPSQRGSVENTGMVTDTIQSPMAAEDAPLDSAHGWPLGIGVDRWGESDSGIGKVAHDGFHDAWSAERDSIAQSALIAGKRSNELDDQLYHEMVEVRAMQREQASAHGRLLDDAATSSLMRRDRREHLEASSAAADVLYQTAQAEYDECAEECRKQLESLERSRPYALDHVVDQVSDIRLSSLISELSQADEDTSSFGSVFTSNWESLLLTDGDCGDFDACILDDVGHDSAIGAFDSAWSAARSKFLASDASAQKRSHELDGLITSEELVLKALQGKKAEELSRELDAKAAHSLFRSSARAEAKLAFENATATNNRARAEYVEFVMHMKMQIDTMVENKKLAISRNLNAEKRNISLLESLLQEISQADDFNSRLNRYFSILPETYLNDAVEYEEAVMDDSDANLESGDKGTGVESRDIFDAWCDAKKRLEQSAATGNSRLEQLSNLPEEEKYESLPENMLAANFASRSAKCEDTNNVTHISSPLSGHGALVFPVDHINQKSASGLERSSALSSAKLGACPKPVGIGEKSLVSMLGERGGLLSHVEGIERNNLTGSEDTVVDDAGLQSVKVEDYPKPERSGDDKPIGSPRNERSDGFSVVAEVNEYGECLEENTVIARAAMRGAKCGALQRPFKVEEESLKSRHSNEYSELPDADGRNTATVMTSLNQEEMPVSFSIDGFPSSRNSDRLLISLSSEHNLQEVSKPGLSIYSQKEMLEKSSPDPAPCHNSLGAAASVGEASFCEQTKIQQDTLAANLFDDHEKSIMREPQTAENASQCSSHVDQSRILVDVSPENRWTSRWSAKKTSSLPGGRVCNSLDHAAGTNVVVAEEAATPSRCDVIFGAFGASSSSLARENTRADSLAGIDVIASAAAWSSNRRNSFSHECCAEESESSSSVLPCSLQDVYSDGFAEIRPSYDGMGLVDNNIVIGSNTPRVAHVTDTDEWEMPAQTPLAFKSMVGQRVNGSSRNDFSCSLHERHALTRTVEHLLVFDQEIATAAAALVSIPDMSDVLLSPGVHTAMSTLSRASQSPRNQGYLSTPDILRIVLTVLRSCEVMSSASGIVSVSKLVQLGLNVLQNVCLRESGCQVLYDVEDSVEVITTFLQFARYEAGIFEKVVHVLHNICSSGTRLQGLQKKFTIVDRILAVHELQQKNVKTYRKDVERLRRTEVLLRELGGDIDVGELTVPNSTLPDESVLSLLSEICVSLS